MTLEEWYKLKPGELLASTIYAQVVKILKREDAVSYLVEDIERGHQFIASYWVFRTLDKSRIDQLLKGMKVRL
jgi:hypothetical protein